MIEDNTFIFSYRKIRQSSFYKNSEMFHLWHELLYRASYLERAIIFNGEEVYLKPGQFIAGRQSLANSTHIHESKVQRYLKKFEKFGMITQERSNRYRLITITNWGEYQPGKKPEKEPEPPKETTEPKDTEKRDKPVKASKKVKYKRSLEERKNDFKIAVKSFKDEYSQHHLKTFFEHWTQPNQDNTKMGFELAKTFAIHFRLQYWRPPVKAQSTPEQSYYYDAEETAKATKEAMERLRKAGHIK